MLEGKVNKMKQIRMKIWILIGLFLVLGTIVFIFFGKHLSVSVPGPILKFFQRVDDISKTYEENKLLHSYIDEFEALPSKHAELERENKELEKLLETTNELQKNFHLIQASTLHREQSTWYDSIIVDKGEKDGVKKNMAVVTADGLIGLVREVHEHSAIIELLSASTRMNYVSASIKGSKELLGVMDGMDQETRTLMVKEIPNHIELEEGTEIVTSGLGGVIPSGLKIGKVKEVKSQDYGLTVTAYLQPFADFYQINYVIIVEER